MHKKQLSASRHLIPVLLAFVVIGLSACRGAPGTLITATAVPPTETPAATLEAAPFGPTLTPAPEEPFSGEGPWAVTFATSDDVMLHGNLYGQGTTAVVLAPMYLGGQEAWASFAQALAAEQPVRVLTFDWRGYGDSEGERTPAHAAVDVAAAVAFMRAQEFNPVALIGAGLGGSASIRVAAEDDSIVGLAALSTPRSFEGLEISDADLAALTVPSLWLAARNDMTQNVEEMQALAGGTDKEMWIYEGSSLQGTFIFDGVDGGDLQRRLLEFVARVAGP